MIENKEINISFDFDGTLSLPSVQKFASKLIEDGYNVRITTTRHSKYMNQDLNKVADRVKITHVVYTNSDDSSFTWTELTYTLTTKKGN